MEKQHLTYFKIENFKRFDSFEMSNLGQFNLIVGDNNVGKTSVLEGLLFNENLRLTRQFHWTAFRWRSVFNITPWGELPLKSVINTKFWDFLFKDTTKSILIKTQPESLNAIELSLLSADELTHKDINIIKRNIINLSVSYWLRQTYSKRSYQVEAAYFEDGNTGEDIPYLPANNNSNPHLPSIFYSYVNSNKDTRKELEDSLRTFIPNLEEIRIHQFVSGQDTISLTLTNSNDIYPLNQYGEGTVRVFHLLLIILVTQGRRLMVDEIGSGIHFTHLKNYWKTIIQLCAKYNVQLFSTTHSLECQRAFIEALEDDSMKQFQKDARNVTLLENKQGEVKAFTYDFEQFEYSLSIGVNTRGGEL